MREPRSDCSGGAKQPAIAPQIQRARECRCSEISISNNERLQSDPALEIPRTVLLVVFYSHFLPLQILLSLERGLLSIC